MQTPSSIDKLLPDATAALETAAFVDGEPVLQLLEETLHVSKRRVETGHATVHVTVAERDEAVKTLLMRQDVVIDRVRLDQPVEVAPPTRQDGDTIIVSLVEERIVVEKRLFLIEELRIRIDQAQHLDTQTVRLRREQAEVDESASPTQPIIEG